MLTAEFLFKFSKLIKENPTLVLNQILIEETILGFQENVVDIVVKKDKNDDKSVIVIQFKNQ